MNNTVVILKCLRCGQEHSYRIPIEEINPSITVNLTCLNIKRLPKLSSFRVDFTRNAPIDKDDALKRIAYQYGQREIEQKIERFHEINNSKLWVIYDFDNYFEEIVSTYVVGSFYPVATSCTTLAERLVNLFILKLRDYFNAKSLSSDLEKYVYTRNQNWQSFDLNMKVLNEWKMISVEQKRWFKDLLDIRNRAVHFQSILDPQPDALKALTTLHKIIDSYFSPYERKDIFRLFEIPGEIWVREEMMYDPFVQAFILPCCSSFSSRGAYNKNNVYHENDAIVGVFSEAEFIEQRRIYQTGLSKERTDLEYEPVYRKYNSREKEFTYRLI